MKKILLATIIGLSAGSAFSQEAGNFEVTRIGKLPAWLTEIKGHTEAKVCGSNEANNEAPCVKISGSQGAVLKFLAAVGAVVKSNPSETGVIGNDAGGN
jgi:hypothetical protein